MGKKKTTRITVITEEVWTFRGQASLAKVWCTECAAQVRMAPAERVAAMLGVSSDAIHHQAESPDEIHDLHYREMPDGRLLICLNSARKAIPLLQLPPEGE